MIEIKLYVCSNWLFCCHTELVDLSQGLFSLFGDKNTKHNKSSLKYTSVEEIVILKQVKNCLTNVYNFCSNDRGKIFM